MHFVINHPLIKDKITRMRRKETPSLIFRQNLFEITQLLAYEVTKNFTVIDVPITTPISDTIGYKLENEIVIVPILRAGLGMSDALAQLLPNASIGHIGLYRDESTLESVQYYSKMPSVIKNSNVIICDPMIATANSITKGIEIVKEFQPKKIIVLGLVAAPEGLAKLKKSYPDIEVYVAALDEKLNKDSYIVPGLGDAGDRIYKTK